MTTHLTPVHDPFDADVVRRDELVRIRRATTSAAVATEVELAWREFERNETTRTGLFQRMAQVRGDWDGEHYLLEVAAAFDAQHPDEAPLYDELNAQLTFGAEYRVVA